MHLFLVTRKVFKLVYPPKLLYNIQFGQIIFDIVALTKNELFQIPVSSPALLETISKVLIPIRLASSFHDIRDFVYKLNYLKNQLRNYERDKALFKFIDFIKFRTINMIAIIFILNSFTNISIK